MSMFNDISCGSKDNEKMPNSYLCTQGDLEKDNGHLLVLVPKRSGTVSVKRVHKEYGTILLKGCWWNSQKADVQFSALRAHCPEVNSKAKVMENCRHTMQPIWKRLRLLFAKLSLQTRSVFVEQSRRYVKSMNPFTRERGEVWDSIGKPSCTQPESPCAEGRHVQRACYGVGVPMFTQVPVPHPVWVRAEGTTGIGAMEGATARVALRVKHLSEQDWFRRTPNGGPLPMGATLSVTRSAHGKNQPHTCFLQPRKKNESLVCQIRGAPVHSAKRMQRHRQTIERPRRHLCETTVVTGPHCGQTFHNLESFLAPSSSRYESDNQANTCRHGGLSTSLPCAPELWCTRPGRPWLCRPIRCEGTADCIHRQLSSKEQLESRSKNGLVIIGGSCRGTSHGKKCTFGLQPKGRRGFTKRPREPQARTLGDLGLERAATIPREDPREEDRMNIVAGD